MTYGEKQQSANVKCISGILTACDALMCSSVVFILNHTDPPSLWQSLTLWSLPPVSGIMMQEDKWLPTKVIKYHQLIQTGISQRTFACKLDTSKVFPSSLTWNKGISNLLELLCKTTHVKKNKRNLIRQKKNHFLTFTLLESDSRWSLFLDTSLD